MTRKWIGVDLDGTLAQYDTFIDVCHIGQPIPEMVERVKRWIAQGHTVKIFTARMSCDISKYRDMYSAVQEWCIKHIGCEMELTNVKDLDMEELWDDRAVQVEKNTGKVLGYSTRGLQ